MVVNYGAGNRKQSETFEDFYDQLENDTKSPPSNQKIIQNMQLDDLVESSNQQHPSVAEIRVEVAGQSDSDDQDSSEQENKEQSFELSGDRSLGLSKNSLNLEVVGHSLAPKPRTEMTFGDLLEDPSVKTYTPSQKTSTNQKTNQESQRMKDPALTQSNQEIANKSDYLLSSQSYILSTS